MSTTAPAVHLAFREYGDASLLVDVLGGDYEQRWSATQAIGRALRDARPPGYCDGVASYQNVVVSFDPLITDASTLEREVRQLADLSAARSPGTTHEIAVVYGGRHGPDLDAVATELGTNPESLVQLHTATNWVVRFVGSPAGAPMLDGWGVPASIARLAQPRAAVEAGSVGVSGRQSTIYNAPSPGGWRLIGRTPQRLFDLDRTPPVEYTAGDSIRFVAVEEWDGN